MEKTEKYYKNGNEMELGHLNAMELGHLMRMFLWRKQKSIAETGMQWKKSTANLISSRSFQLTINQSTLKKSDYFFVFQETGTI